MQVFTTQRELRSGMQYETFNQNKRTEINSFDNRDTQNTHRSNLDAQPEQHVSTKEAVCDQIDKSFLFNCPSS